MKKTLFTSLLLSTILFAEQNSDYIGLSIGNAQINGKVSAGTISQTVNSDDTHYSFAMGHYYGKKGRIYASFNFVPPKDSVDVSNAFSFGYDFLLPIGESNFSLFAGPVLGYTWYESSAPDISIDLSGFHYGAQAGAIAHVSDTIDVEAGYRYLLQTATEKMIINNVALEIESQNLKLWYIGVNFRF